MAIRKQQASRPRETPSSLHAVFGGLMECARSGEDLEAGLRLLLQELGSALGADECALRLGPRGAPEADSVPLALTWTAPRARGAARRQGAESALEQPITVRQEVRGLLSVHRRGPAPPFSPEDRHRIREAGTCVAVVTDHWFMLDRENRRGRQSRLLSQVQTRIIALHGLQDLLDFITRSLVETLGYRFAAVFLLEPGGGSLRVGSLQGGEPEIEAAVARLPVADRAGCGLVGAAAATGRAVVCNDVRRDPRYVRAYRETCSELDLPIPGPDGLVGVLSIQSDREGAFETGDVELFGAFAAQVAAAIGVARSHERDAWRSRHLLVLHEVQSAVARLVDPRQLVELAAGAIHRAFGGCRVIIGLLDRSRQELVVQAHAGDGAVPADLRRVSLSSGSGAAIQVARTGHAVRHNDPGTEPDSAPVDAESLSGLHVPILAGQEVAGVLTVESRRRHAFHEEDVATFEAVAGILGVAIENAGLFERVEQEKEEWARTFDAITDMVSIHDGDYRLLRANRALGERAMTHIYELVGRSCGEVYSGIVGGPIDCPHTEAERRHAPVRREIETPGRGVFRLTALPGFRAGGHQYSVHLCEEITEERRLREQLLQSEKMAAVGQLVSGVAHELNNPLASVMGYTQLTLGRVADSKVRSNLERVFSEAQRAAKIVQNLLTFARKHKPERRYLGLNGIVEKTLELRAYELRVSNIEVETDLQADLPMTMLDFHQMQQVVLNIVTNAEQAMLRAHGRGRLRIRTRVTGGRLELRIEDDGPGIPVENLSRVFDPFFTTKPVGQGTGLGLSICDGIVKEHGGRLMAESAPGRGAILIVELPVVTALGCAEPPGPARAADASPVGGSILVVDDEPSIQGLMVEILTMAGYRVDTAGSGEAALAKIGTDRYDLVISDLKMPGMGGARFYDRLREARPELVARILFTTGETVSPETDAFLRRSRSPTILKPFTLDELKAAVGRFFRGN